MTPTSRPGPPRAGRSAVDDVTVLLLSSPAAGTQPVVEVLDALATQTRPPQRILLSGLDPDVEGLDRVVHHPLVVDHRVPLLLRPAREGADARWQLVEDARRTLPVHDTHWIWFLTPDSRPEPDALAALAGAVRRSSRVGVVGPKLVRDDDPRLLLALGHHLTPAGRATDAGQPGLVDQGQLDLRQDVLGVPLPGALVASSVLEAVGGLDRAFGEDGVDGLDLSWRAHLAGHRVVVAPDAVVRQGTEGLGVTDPLRTRLRERQVALARGGFWSSSWRALGVLVTSLLAAAVLLLVKRPAEAAAEWTDVRAVLAPARGWGARRRFRPRRTVRPRDLAGLHGSTRTGWRATLDTVGDALDPRASGPGRDGRAGTRGAVETGPVPDELAELAGEGRRSRWSWPLALALALCLGLTAWAWRDLVPGLMPGGMGVVGPELGVADTDARGLWSSALDGWRGGGLGHDRPAESWLPWLAGLALGAQVLPGAATAPAAPALAGALALAAPASLLTAYLALRRATHHRWPRALLALGWAGLAPLTAALGEGRVGPVAVHVLAPLLLAGYAVSATPRGGARRTAAVFATVLGLALAALWVPVVLVLATLGGLVLVLVGPGAARWRGLVLALLPWVLLLPWLSTLSSDPVRLLGGAGATLAAPGLPAAAEPWQVLLLHPGAGLDAGSLEAIPLWLAAVLWAGALGSLLLPGRPGRRAALLVGTALVCVALAVLAIRTGLGVLPDAHPEAGLVVTAWPGTLLSLGGAALLLAAGILVDRLLPDRTTAPRDDLPGGGAGRRRTLNLAAAALLTVPVAATALLTASTGSLAPGERTLPAVAAEQARGPYALRTLVLEPAGGPTDGDDAVGSLGGTFRVDLVGAEPEPAAILRDRTTELTSPGPGAPEVTTVGSLLEGADADEVGREVTALGAGYVLLRADEDHPAAGVVDRVTGLTRVSSPAGEVLWRVTDGEPGRLRLVGADGAPLGRLDATGPHAQTRGTLDVPAGTELVVAEGEGWQQAARVSVDGEPAQVFGSRVSLPEGAHVIEIDLRRPGLTWQLAALAVAGITAFLALPFGRTEDDEESA